MRETTKQRNQFVRLILNNLISKNNETWNKVCLSLVSSNNLLTDSQSKYFKHLGKFFPQKDLADRKLIHAPRLHPQLIEEFNDLQIKFVIDFQIFYSEFTTMMIKFCNHATRSSDFDDVFSQLIMQPVNSAEWVYAPAAHAKGWEDYSKEDFKNEYKDVLEKADFYLSARKLI